MQRTALRRRSLSPLAHLFGLKPKTAQRPLEARLGASAATVDREPSDPACRAAYRTAYNAGRQAQRARGHAIFTAPSAAIRPAVAAHLANSTDLSVKDAIALLDTAAAFGRAGRTYPSARPERADEPPSAEAVAAQIVAAGGNRRRAERQ